MSRCVRKCRDLYPFMSRQSHVGGNAPSLRRGRERKGSKARTMKLDGTARRSICQGWSAEIEDREYGTVEKDIRR